MREMHFPSKAEMDLLNQEIIDAYDYLGNAASTTDCTGLIPSAPASRAELESYQNMYQFEPPYLDDSIMENTEPEENSRESRQH